MKTTNKIQKTALTAVVAAGLTIISFASNAQPNLKSLFEDIETNHIAMAVGKTNNNFGTTTETARNFTGANTFAAYLMPETEEPLQLEDWMTDESSFATALKIETETEYPLQVESWMTNEKTFGFNSIDMKIETEKPMSLESWMVDKNTFSKTELVYHKVSTEKKLLVEAWMINPKTWKN